MIEASSPVVHGKRLLDIDGLARLKRLESVSAVAIVPGGDRHRVDLWVLEDFARVGGGVAELIALGKRLCVHPARRADRHQAQILERVKMRKKHRFRVVSGADHAEPDFSQRCSAVKANGARFAFERAVVSIGVLEHDADGAA